MKDKFYNLKYGRQNNSIRQNKSFRRMKKKNVLPSTSNITATPSHNICNIKDSKGLGYFIIFLVDSGLQWNLMKNVTDSFKQNDLVVPNIHLNSKKNAQKYDTIRISVSKKIKNLKRLYQSQ